MEFDGEIIYFNIFDMKHHNDSYSVFAINAVNPIVQQFPKFNCRGKLKVAVNKHHGLKEAYDVKMGKMLKKMVAHNGDLDPQKIPPIARKFELQPD